MIGLDDLNNSGEMGFAGGSASATNTGGTNAADFSKTFGNSGGLNFPLSWWLVVVVVVGLLAWWLWKKK